jgi:Tfp pilus assembly protein FimT
MIFSKKNLSGGMTLVEILVSMAVLIILLSVGLFHFSRARVMRELDIQAETIASELSKARTRAVAGEGGLQFGVYFATSSYVSFRGSSYNSSDPLNVVFTLPNNMVLSDTISGSGNYITFSRITGQSSSSSTVTISVSGVASSSRTIHVGTMGEVSILR